ncbi:MAG: HEAT repeat domain-containing protein [Planctomycetota bacterium]|nr:MAG: HEAT repeat domain-containing protein [Planctomycetota bacterium]
MWGRIDKTRGQGDKETRGQGDKGTGRHGKKDKMKLGLSLKLGIFVVAVFGVIIAGMFLYQPLRYAWLKSRLMSKDPEVRDAAIKTFLAESERSLPYLRRWLSLKDTNLRVRILDMLWNAKGNIWEEVLPEIEKILAEEVSDLTDGIFIELEKKDFDWKKRFRNKPDCLVSGYCYELLSSPEPHERRDIAIELEKLGSIRAAPRLMTILRKDPFSWVRYSAASALAAIGGSGVFESMVYTLENDAGERVRKIACDIIGGLENPRGFAPLLELLKKEEEYTELSRLAAQSLVILADKRHFNELLEELESTRKEIVLLAVVGALSWIGDVKAMKPILERYEKEKDEFVRKQIMRLLNEFNIPDDVEVWLDILREPAFKFMHRRAIKTLGQLGDSRAVEPLMEVLSRSPKGWEPCDAAAALGLIGDPRAIDALMEHHGGGVCATNAAKALGLLGAKSVEDKCIELIKDRNMSHRHPQVALTLGEIGSKKAVEPLIELLKNPKNFCVASRIAYALGKIGGERALKVLLALLDDHNDKYWRFEKYEALGFIDDKAAADALLQCLATEKKSREWIVRALGNQSDPGVIEPLIKVCMYEKDSSTRRAAAKALAKIGGKAVSQKVIAAYLAETSDKTARCYALMALGYIGDPATTDFLVSVIENEKEDYRKWPAVKALSGIKTVRAIREFLRFTSGGTKLWSHDRRLIVNLFESGHLEAIPILINLYKRWTPIHLHKEKSAAADPGTGKTKTTLRGIYGFYRYWGGIYWLWKRMPESFPRGRPGSLTQTRKIHARKMKNWFDKNKHRLAWDAEGKRYFLKPEK